MTTMNDDRLDDLLLGPSDDGRPGTDLEPELDERRRRAAVGRREHIGPPLVHTPAPSIWAALEVTPSASWDDIRAAHRRLLIQWHPDRHVTGSDEEQRYAAERLAEVNAAFALLRERHRR